MSWGAVAGAAISVGGSLLSGSSQPKVRWKPMSTSNLWGDTSYDKKNRRIIQNTSDFSNSVIDATTANTDYFQNGSPLTGMGRDYMAGAGGAMGGYVDAANNYGMPPEALYNSAMGGMAAITGGMGNLFGAAANNPYALQQMGYGADLLGREAGNYNDVAAQRLDLLRQGAAPYEERAQNSMFTKLYGMGQIGTPGGQLGMESFGKGLALADNARQLDAMNFAEQLYGRDLNNVTALKGIGANMFGGGVSNYMGGLTNAANIGRNAFDMTGNMLGTGVNWNNLGYSRANDRLSRTSDLFGFGAGLEGYDRSMVASNLNLLSGITGELDNSSKLGLSAAGPGQPMGGNPTGAALGGFLGGLGNGMMTGNIPFPNWGGGSPSTGTPFNINNGNYNIGPISSGVANIAPPPTYNI